MPPSPKDTTYRRLAAKWRRLPEAPSKRDATIAALHLSQHDGRIFDPVNGIHVERKSHPAARITPFMFRAYDIWGETCREGEQLQRWDEWREHFVRFILECAEKGTYPTCHP